MREKIPGIGRREAHEFLQVEDLANPQTLFLSFLAALLADLLSECHGGGSDFDVCDVSDSAVESGFVNVRIEDVADDALNDLARNLEEQRLVPHRLVQQLPESLGLHDPQREDASRCAPDGLESELGQLDEPHGEIRDEVGKVVDEGFRKVEQLGEPRRDLPEVGILREHYRKET